MANTQLSDLFIPVPFGETVAELSANKAGVVTSGAVSTNNSIQSLMTAGGLRLELPFLHDTAADGSGTPSSDDSADLLVAAKVSGNSQNAIRISRNQAWSTAKLAGQASGDDILGFAASRVAAYDINSSNIVAMNCLEGVCAAGSLTASNPSVSITRDMIISELYNSMGDGVANIGLMVMHPALVATLKSEDAALWGFSASGIGFETYMGIRVIVDQNVTSAPIIGSEDDDYCAYFLGEGYLQYGKANVESVIDVNNFAGGGRSIESLIYRKDEIIHPDGFSFTGSVAADTPTDAELATGGNWTQVYADRRNIKLMKLVASA